MKWSILRLPNHLLPPLLIFYIYIYFVKVCFLKTTTTLHLTMSLNIGTLAWIVEWSLIPMEEYILVKIRKLRGREGVTCSVSGQFLILIIWNGCFFSKIVVYPKEDTFSLFKFSVYFPFSGFQDCLFFSLLKDTCKFIKLLCNEPVYLGTKHFTHLRIQKI